MGWKAVGVKLTEYAKSVTMEMGAEEKIRPAGIV